MAGMIVGFDHHRDPSAAGRLIAGSVSDQFLLTNIVPGGMSHLRAPAWASEYSHAVGAGLYVTALALLTTTLVARRAG